MLPEAHAGDIRGVLCRVSCLLSGPLSFFFIRAGIQIRVFDIPPPVSPLYARTPD